MPSKEKKTQEPNSDSPTPPIIDARVQYAGASRLRGLNTRQLKELRDPLVVQFNDVPVVVVVPYDHYMKMQQAFWPSSAFDVLNRLVLLVEDERLESLLSKWEHLDMEALQKFLNTPSGPASTGDTSTEPPPVPEGMQRCRHCGDLFEINRPTSTCRKCFLSGHREGNCVKCAETEEVARRAAEDSTGADRPDIDRLAFTD